MSVWELVGRTLVIVVHLCFEDGGGNEGNGDQLLVCAWGAHDEAVADAPTVSDGGVGHRSGLGKAGGWG